VLLFGLATELRYQLLDSPERRRSYRGLRPNSALAVVVPVALDVRACSPELALKRRSNRNAARRYLCERFGGRHSSGGCSYHCATPNPNLVTAPCATRAINLASFVGSVKRLSW